MDPHIPVINKTLELFDCRDQWFFDQEYRCWCLEDVLYTLLATTPKFQRLSIFVPAPYLNEDGTINRDGVMGNFTTQSAPVVFENNSAGYMQMPHTWLGGPRDEAGKYLERGMVFVTCGCRGRESRDSSGRLCGKSPWTLVDLKTAIRFLRHNAAVLPGNLKRIISVGCSAGGAMSSLVGITGDDPRYLPYLEQNGAFMDQSDAVYAAQVYCPIVDLDHADLAYEWQFQNDLENGDSPAGPAGTMSPFQAALSRKLASAYVTYFNSLKLKHPDTGASLTLNEDGRSGSGYDYLMQLLERSASDYLSRLDAGKLPEKYSVGDYLLGRYIHQVPAPKPDATPKKDDLGLHHAGATVMMPPTDEGFLDGIKPVVSPSLGDLVSRPPKGVPYQGQESPMMEVPGTDKTVWLSWDGRCAHITDLDDYLLNHRRRMKPCTSFDTLGMDSGENQELGTPEQDYMHFCPYIAPVISELKEQFSDEYARYYQSWENVIGDDALAERRRLINPMALIGPADHAADFFRIRVGSCDADTAFTISMALALKLAETGKSVDYALVWDQPHCEADYPGEVCDWIENIVKTESPGR